MCKNCVNLGQYTEPLNSELFFTVMLSLALSAFQRKKLLYNIYKNC